MEETAIIKSLPSYSNSKEVFRELKHNGSRSAGAINKLFETEADRQGLLKWKTDYDLKHGEGACDLYLKECCDRGTMLHENIESFYKGEAPVYDDETLGKYLKLQQQYHDEFLCDVEPIFIEKLVVNEKLKMHGIVDCIGFYKGKLSIIDFKFASKEKDEQYITDYRRQVAVYALIIYKETGLLIEQCVIACGSHKNPNDPKVQIFKYKTSILVKALIDQLTSINYFKMLNGELKLYKVTNENDKSIVVCAESSDEALTFSEDDTELTCQLLGISTGVEKGIISC